ncbi:MAG TPA: hypothetical protein VIO64_03410 [Pseudobacteroides sp.]|uniref:hypothetical protein n=1 Tax=Pseudobacteroides sp. TaxID=1968840 RepID=UPI002F937F0B
MLRIKWKHYLSFMFLVTVMLLIMCSRTFAATPTPTATSISTATSTPTSLIVSTPKPTQTPITYTFATPITCPSSVTRCEIQVIPWDAASPLPSAVPSPRTLPAHTVTTSGTTTTVKVYVQGASNDIVRGMQVNLAEMRYTKLTFYDREDEIDQQVFKGVKADIDSLPANCDTLAFKISPDKKVAKKNPMIKIAKIKYTKSTREPSEKTAEFWSLTEFSTSAETVKFKAMLEKYATLSNSTPTSSPPPVDTAIHIPTDKNFYHNAKSNTLFFCTHSNKSFFVANDAGERVFIKTDLTNNSTTNWIYQGSCFVINQESAPDWCNYFTANTAHKIKGIFGFSQISYSAIKIPEEFFKYSQKRPMLDSYLNSTGNMYMFKDLKEKGFKGFDEFAYSTAIVSVDNLKDTMFDISKPSNDPTYRMYKLQPQYSDDFKITPGKMGTVGFDWYSTPGIVKYEFYKYHLNSSEPPDKFLIINLPVKNGVDPKTMNHQYLANELNNMNLDDFDELMRESQSSRATIQMDTVMEEVKALRADKTANVYKQFILHWLSGFSADRPLAVSIKTVNGLPETLYAELVKTPTGYQYVKNADGSIKWTAEVLKGYKPSEACIDSDL